MRAKLRGLRRRITATSARLDEAVKDRLTVTGQLMNIGGPEEFAKSIDQQRMKIAIRQGDRRRADRRLERDGGRGAPDPEPPCRGANFGGTRRVWRLSRPRQPSRLPKVSLASLIAQGFEIKAATGNQVGVVGTLILQKDNEVFMCASKDLSIEPTAFECWAVK